MNDINEQAFIEWTKKYLASVWTTTKEPLTYIRSLSSFTGRDLEEAYNGGLDRGVYLLDKSVFEGVVGAARKRAEELKLPDTRSGALLGENGHEVIKHLEENAAKQERERIATLFQINYDEDSKMWNIGIADFYGKLEDAIKAKISNQECQKCIEIIKEKQAAIIQNFNKKYPDKASWTPEAQHYQRVIDLCGELIAKLKETDTKP